MNLANFHLILWCAYCSSMGSCKQNTVSWWKNARSCVLFGVIKNASSSFFLLFIFPFAFQSFPLHALMRWKCIQDPNLFTSFITVIISHLPIRTNPPGYVVSMSASKSNYIAFIIMQCGTWCMDAGLYCSISFLCSKTETCINALHQNIILCFPVAQSQTEGQYLGMCCLNIMLFLHQFTRQVVASWLKCYNTINVGIKQYLNCCRSHVEMKIATLNNPTHPIQYMELSVNKMTIWSGSNK